MSGKEEKNAELKRLENPVEIIIDHKHFDSENILIPKKELKSFKNPSDVLNIFTAYEDKSAIISLFLKPNVKKNYKKYWTESADLENVMRHYSTYANFNVKNFLSILMFDWFEPEPGELDYSLWKKSLALEQFKTSLMKKLLKIFDNKEYKPHHYFYLRIIYQFLHEINSKMEAKRKNICFQKQTSVIGDIKGVPVGDDSFQNMIYDFINDTLTIQNLEYKIKILKILVVFLQNNSTEKYASIKEKILDIVHYSFKQPSFYQISIDSITKHCDERFFQLVFLLKENSLNSFEFGFEELIKSYQKFYGDYWEVAIKENARLLYHAAIYKNESPQLPKIAQLILIKTDFININSTILTTFKEVDSFYTIFNGTLNDEEIKFLNEMYDMFDEDDSVDIFRKYLEDKKFTLKMLLGRRYARETSLLENILSQRKFYPVLGDLWMKFELGKKPEYLMLKNPLGKYLIDYVIQTRSINQLTAFLSLSSHQNELNYNNQKHYMILKNILIYSITEKSLFDYHLDSDLCIRLDPKLDFYKRLAYLLEELGTVDEFKSDVMIDSLLEKIKKTDNITTNSFNLDLLLGHIITYWNNQSASVQAYKKLIMRKNPFFELLFMIIEDKSDEFLQEYSNKISQIEGTYLAKYTNEPQQFNESSCVLKFISILMLAAFRRNQQKILDCIFSNNSSLTISNILFTENMKVTELHNYAALTLMKQGCQLGGNNFPNDWLAHVTLVEFLDSRINYHEKELIEIDCGFMSCIKRQKIKVSSISDISENLLIQEDMESFKYLEQNETHESILTHPVISMIVAIKSRKYNIIYMYNFWIFLLLFFFPFLWQLQHHYLGLKKLNSEEKTIFTNIWLCGVAYLICREIFQCFFAVKFKMHFWDKTNLIDLILITFSIALIGAYSNLLDNQTRKFLEVGLIIITSVSLVSDVPTSKSPLYMHIFRKVAITFLNLFYSFALILAAFALSFIVVFDNGEKDMDSNVQINATRNFENLYTSLTKVLTMLSGEYSIEPITLSVLQLLVFCIFVITSFILYNLILGLSIENINEVKIGSKGFIILREIRKIISAATKIEKFYQSLMTIKIYLGERLIFRPLQILLVDFPSGVVKFFISRNTFIHNISKVYVNKKSGEVYVRVDKTFEPILSKCNGIKNKFKIDKNTLDEMLSAISSRSK